MPQVCEERVIDMMKKNLRNIFPIITLLFCVAGILYTRNYYGNYYLTFAFFLGMIGLSNLGLLAVNIFWTKK